MDLERRKGSIIDFLPGKDLPDLLGERTQFRRLALKIVSKLVTNGEWFSFCTKADKSQFDIFSLENEEGTKLGRLICDEINVEAGYRTTLYRYLLHDYLCYCEIPTVLKQRDNTGYRDSFTKCFVTTNVGVIAKWLGISYAEAKLFYHSRVGENDLDRDDDMYPYVKLYIAKDGTRKVSKPRKDLDLSTSGIRIVPMFAIKKGLDLLYNIASQGFYNVTFLKDSGQVRTINVCFSFEKLSEVYKDRGALLDAYSEQYKGVFLDCETIFRGYIRAIEVGTCIKSSPVRAINLARIIKIEKAEPDLTFINVELGYVKDTFLDYVASKNINYKEFVDMLEVFQVGTSREYNGKVISSYMELESWVTSQEILVSTPFLKQLALFMLGNPQWFEGYTGEAKPTIYDVDDSDSDDSFDLDDLDFDLDFG